MALTTVGDTPYFNPRAPCGARPEAYQDAIAPLNFNPRAPCGARQGAVWLYRRDALYFNPRAPCGARQGGYVMVKRTYKFQSTRPLRGATGWNADVYMIDFISIHAPLAGRDRQPVTNQQIKLISIHAPLAGRDKRQQTLFISPIGFQSTRPLRGATRSLHFSAVSAFCISIHAPLAGRDGADGEDLHLTCLFQSTRPLRGATRRLSGWENSFLQFQSTRPLRGATVPHH